jgi:C2H2-type zinc finger
MYLSFVFGEHQMDDSDEDDDSLANDSLERAAEAMVDAVVRTIVRVPASTGAAASPTVLDSLPHIALQSRSEAPSSTAVDTSSQFSSSRSASNINPERDNYNVDRITECWQCSRVFDCRKSLLRHLKEHGVDLPFKCYLCDASFASRLASLNHKASMHGSDWSMLRDKNRVGTDIADFADFVDHVVEEALAGGTIAPGTARRTRDGMELDIRLESDYAQRKVFCSLCPKRFWSLQDLRRHMRSHTGKHAL